LNNTIQKLISLVKFFSGSCQRQWNELAQQQPFTAILCYHTVSHRPQRRKDLFDFEQGIAEKDFEAQIKFMLRHFKPVKPSEVFLKENMPRNRFAVTFDDGLEDNYTVAAPILKRLGVPAAFYVVSEYVGTDKIFWWERLAFILRTTQKWGLSLQCLTSGLDKLGELPREFKLHNLQQREFAHTQLCGKLLMCRQQEADKFINSIAELLNVRAPVEGRDFPLMNWEQLRDLSRQGFEIGGHSATHINLAKANAEELKREIVDSIKNIEARIKDRVLTFAYPYGRPENFSEDVAENVRSTGCIAAFTFERQFASGNQNRFTLPRISFKKGWSCACAFHLHNAFLATKSRLMMQEEGGNSGKP